MAKLGLLDSWLMKSTPLTDERRKTIYDHFSRYKKKHSIKINIYSGFF